MENAKQTSQAGTKRVDTKKLATLAMLTCISFIVLYLSKLIPINVAGFLTFDLKDVVIVISGFIYGPIAAAGIAVVVSVIEMVTISTTGPVGMLMNVLSTCAFACTASVVYKRVHTQRGAIEGLIVGALGMTVIMILWNYLITPLYMGVPRDVVVSMLIPVFLPFNLIKAGINAALAMLIYKPTVTALRRAKLLPESAGGHAPQRRAGIMLIVLVLLATLVLLALVLAGVI